jgi:hypothetical protein
MKHYIFAGLAAVLIAGELIGSEPPANAGCQYGGIAVSRCDGAIQPDGVNSGSSGYPAPNKRCDQMGPDLYPWGLAFNDPPTHIDD